MQAEFFLRCRLRASVVRGTQLCVITSVINLDMVHLPQSEPSIQSSTFDNKGDECALIMALMMQLDGSVLWKYFCLTNNSLKLFNQYQTMTCASSV